jgi:hypothetical protein
VQPLGGEHVRGDPVLQGRERRGAGADLVGELVCPLKSGPP